MKASINAELQFLEIAALNLFAAANQNLSAAEFNKIITEHMAQKKALIDLIPILAEKIEFKLPIAGYRMAMATNALFDMIVQICFPTPDGRPAGWDASDKFIDLLFQIMHQLRQSRKNGNVIVLSDKGLTDIHGRPIAPTPTGPVRS